MKGAEVGAIIGEHSRPLFSVDVRGETQTSMEFFKIKQIQIPNQWSQKLRLNCVFSFKNLPLTPLLPAASMLASWSVTNTGYE